MLKSFRNTLLILCVALSLGKAFPQTPSEAPPQQPGLNLAVPVEHNALNGRTIYQGDILLRPNAQAHAADSPTTYSASIAFPQYLWPKVNGIATVFYVIDAASDPNATPAIQSAIATFNADFPNVIQWVQWTSSAQGPNYVDVNLSSSDTSGVCAASEGYEAIPAQPVSGSTSCTVATILHELGHVVGLWHEQTRSDRNTYLKVNYNNVIKSSRFDFDIRTDNVQNLALYDYASLMHYQAFAFTRTGGSVLESIPAGIPLAGIEGVPAPSIADYSAGDKETINRLYGAPPTQVTVTSNPVGLQVSVDGATVTTPQTFAWALNSSHTLNVPPGVQTLTGNIANSTTPATFYYTYGRWNDSTAQSHTIKVSPGSGGSIFPTTAPLMTTYSANFVQLVPYNSTVSPPASGQVAVSPLPLSYPGANGSFFVARQVVKFTATPATGWNFYEYNNAPFWLAGGLSANPKSFYVPDTGNPVNTTVQFSNTPIYRVDVTPVTFSSNLSVLVDNVFAYTPKNYSAYYDPTWTFGSTHTLSLPAVQSPYSFASRYVFSSWSDKGAMSHNTAPLRASNATYIAALTPQFLPATNFNYPPCGGTGTLSPSSPTNDGFYPTGQLLTYTATPASGWTFAGWTYDLTGVTNPATLTARDETLAFANFNTVAAPLTLTSLSPSIASFGGGPFTLSLIGTGFAPGSLVAVNGNYRTVTYLSPTTLQVPMTAADIAAPGALQVLVENFPSGSSGCAVFGYQTFLIRWPAHTTKTTVSSSLNPSTFQSNVTFSAAVVSTTTPGGTATFQDGSTVLGTAPLSASGVATYTTPSLSAGTHTITAVYSGDSSHIVSTSAKFTQTVNKAAPSVTWPTPAPIYYGTPLSSAQLNATASVPGTFVYNPPAGAIPPPGNNTPSVAFIPTDTDDYTAATTSVLLQVLAPAATVSLSPSSLTFGNLLLNSQSAGQTVTLTNTDTAALNIASIGLTGTNASYFVTSNTCGSAVAAAASCTISVSFSPAAVGAATAQVAITDSAFASPQSFTVSGTGVTLPAAYTVDTPIAGTFGYPSAGLPVNVDSGNGMAPIWPATAFTDIKVAFVNAFGIPETCGPQMTYSVQVEYPQGSTPWPLYNNGSLTGTVAPCGKIEFTGSGLNFSPGALVKPPILRWHYQRAPGSTAAIPGYWTGGMVSGSMLSPWTSTRTFGAWDSSEPFIGRTVTDGAADGSATVTSPSMACTNNDPGNNVTILNTTYTIVSCTSGSMVLSAPVAAGSPLTMVFTSADKSGSGSMLVGGNQLGPAPYAVFGTVATPNSPVCLVADSIGKGSGQNVPANGSYIMIALSQANAALGLATKVAVNRPWLEMSQVSDTSFNYLTNHATRFAYLSKCKYAIGDFTNDVFILMSSATTAETNLLALATQIQSAGVVGVFYGTVTPRTTSTDNFLTAANQTPFLPVAEVQRQAENAWMRDGGPIDSVTGAPVAVGTSSATSNRANYYSVTGTIASPASGPNPAAHPFNNGGFFELTDTLEVNSSNVLTRNGGLWLADPANRTASDVTVTSGSNVLVSGGSVPFVPGDNTHWVGGPGIPSNTSITVIDATHATMSKAATASSAAFAGVVTIGGPIGAYVAQGDGVHPSGAGHAVDGASLGLTVAAAMP